MEIHLRISYNIGDLVYHVLPDSPKGIVVDARYLFSTNAWEYLVTFDPMVESKWYSEVELSTSKQYK